MDQKEKSHHLSDAFSNGSSVTKPKQESLPTGLQTKSKKALASGQPFIAGVDASTNQVTLNGNLRLFGTDNKDSTEALASQVVAMVTGTGGRHGLENVKYALATIHGIGPRDELEGLLAVQMVGVHSLAVECLRGASLKDQTTEGMDANIQRATKLLRTFTAQMEALNRHRGKLSQQMVVSNVNVSDGGQAIVGHVSHDGRGKATKENDADKGK